MIGAGLKDGHERAHQQLPQRLSRTPLLGSVPYSWIASPWLLQTTMNRLRLQLKQILGRGAFALFPSFYLAGGDGEDAAAWALARFSCAWA